MTEILHFPSSLREMARKAMLETSGKPNNISESGMVETLPWAFMKQIPGQEPPPGQVSNFTDPPNLVITVAVVLSISSFLVSVAEGFRIESKVSSARSFTWDDYTSFLATVDAQKSTFSVNRAADLELG
ncbi:hypothetical protein GJ744_000295 [Endocarpon pusillum]|uniref:Uncharacterized protein n=1 Tax=Endocarpon pusillum TaxID=364733 RepID=A0A8H7E922_9EURO|nr:hypothetical protein GJ744_000295 [Endocarpon pusillum]